MDPIKEFIEVNGQAIVVPLRYDLSKDEVTLKRTLDSLDGVIFSGGFLALRTFSEMPEATQAFYKTAVEVVKYTIEHRLPLMGICQGYQLICKIIIDLFEPAVTEELAAQALDGPDSPRLNRHKLWDTILSDLKIFQRFRTTKWQVEAPNELRFLREVPDEIIKAMSTQKLQKHFHNFAVTSANFKACNSLSNFFHVVAVDDGLP